MPGPERHLRFVNFNDVFQWVAVGIDHRPPKLLQQKPSRLITAEAKLRLKLQRRHAVGMAGHDMRGEKPGPQWQMAAVHHRASRHGCLPPTARTLPGRAISLQRPALAGATTGTHEALRPPSFRQIKRTRFFIGKKRVESLARHRPIVFPSGWHMWNNTRTLPISKPRSTTSCAAGSKGISLGSTYVENIA